MSQMKETFEISRNQIQDIYTTVKSLSDSYMEKEEGQSDIDWLAVQYKCFFPSISDAEAVELGKATVYGVRRFNTNLQEAMEAAEEGKSKEKWFTEKMTEAIEGSDITETGKTIQALDSALISGNQHLMEQRPIRVQGDELSMTMPEIFEIEETTESSFGQWNSFTVKEVISHLGEGAALVGLQAMNHPEGFYFAADSIGEAASSSQSLKELIKKKDMEQVKTILTAALKIGADSKKLPCLSNVASVDTIASIASNGLEYISTLSKFSAGEITMMQAMEHVGLSGVCLLYNLCSVNGIRSISTALLSQIPIIGPVLGNVVGGIISVTMGTQFHERIKKTIQKVEMKVRTVVNNAWNRIKTLGQKIKSKIKNFCSWLLS